jgi:DNA polymerase III subunit epsilon
MKLNLNRPLAFFDLETTGVNVVKDKIVEIAIYKVNPDDSTETLTTLINPQIPIPAEVTAIHGINDEDVKDKPTFPEFAPKLDKFLKNCDLTGYNSNKFDVPMLIEEFLRCGVNFDIKKRKLIDVQNIFHKMEPRTLKAAYKFYCGKDLTGAHEAEADTMATYEILVKQLDFYKDTEYTDNDGNVSTPVKNDVDALSEFSYNKNNADLVGHIGLNKAKKEVFNFGKYKGKVVEDVFKTEPQYYDWMMKSEFPLSTKNLITEIMFRGFKNSSIIVK